MNSQAVTRLIIRPYLYSAGGILLIAALVRFLMAAGQSQILTLPEPVLGIPLRYAVLLVGGFELIVALICLFGQRISLQLVWLAWLATNYWVYRIGLLTMHCHLQATCIGNFSDPLQLKQEPVQTIVGLIPFYLLLGSYAALLWPGFVKIGKIGRAVLPHRRKEPLESIKMSCPDCGRHIKFAVQNLGQKASCPECQTVITLRQPEETLKMSCFFCKEHIEFPAHGIGEKMPCPHCKMDITLKEPA